METGDDPRLIERQNILTRLLDSVKQCQVRFGGRSELAADGDSRVSCLCSAWESALQHGMKQNNKALLAIKQVGEITGLSKVTDFFSDIKTVEGEPVYWHYVKEHLTKHEIQRFFSLKNIDSDTGRGRAWLRASFNEHSLERYMHMLLEKIELLSQYYEEWSFLRDEERSSMLPMMAAGLGSILFAITIDRSELNKSSLSQNSVHINTNYQPIIKQESEPKPVIAGETIAVNEKRKEKKKKKKIANIVSFDEEDESIVVTSKNKKDTTTVNSNKQILKHSFKSNEESVKREATPNSDSTQTKAIDIVSSGSVKSSQKMQHQEFIKHDNPSFDRSVSSTVSSISNLSADRLSRSSLGSFSSEDVDFGESTTTLTPLSPSGHPIDDDLLHLNKSKMPLGTSVDSLDVSMLSVEDTVSTNAHHNSLSQLTDRRRTQGDGGNTEVLLDRRSDSISAEDLKQAVVAMMLHKDEVEDKNKSLKNMLDQEMEISSTLRAEIEEMKISFNISHEKEQTKNETLQKENELLKHQLRKYINAVQLLRTEGASDNQDNLGIALEDPQPVIPPVKPSIDYSHEASEYEKKLIQVAEMHGELMEFNELLHRQLNAKDAVIRSIKEELTDLRGPLPYNGQSSDDSLSGDLESSLISRSLINIWIPSAFLGGSKTDSHHVYQVYIRIRDEEWNVYRRYSKFLDVHTKLKKVYPLIGKIEFPPKKTLGSKDPKVVTTRRKMLQTYLRKVINHLLEKNTDLADHVSKDKLIAILPFFNDQPDDKKKGKKKNGATSRQQQQQASGSLPQVDASQVQDGGPGQYEGF
ncbi:hypothetical protein SNE40_019173 [Patella caerulea]|uniref:Sorting nexin-29 n=1 Tax=Patella caerulea TaxID=87958 RepID=A0AAN8JA32_PATCE